MKNGAEEYIKIFEDTLRNLYIEEYGIENWNSKTNAEKDETLHLMFGSFLTVAKRRAQSR